MQVSASDADDPDTVNAQLKFSIVNQIPNPRDTFYFDINPNNGEIFITDEGTSTHQEQNSNVHVIVSDFCWVPNCYFIILLLYCRSWVSEGQAHCNIQPWWGPWQSWCPEEEVWGLLYSKEQHTTREQPLLHMCRACWWESTETHTMIMLFNRFGLTALFEKAV